MKRLTIIRHAKSSWNHAGLPDHERPLNKRGNKAAPMIGEVLSEREFQPDVLISSTAVRALSTAREISQKIGYPPDAIISEPDIYMACTDELIGVISRINEDFGHAVLFGHNPGFENLVDELLRDGSVDRMPTCAVADLELSVDYWGEVSPSCARLIDYLYPRMFDRE